MKPNCHPEGNAPDRMATPSINSAQRLGNAKGGGGRKGNAQYLKFRPTTRQRPGRWTARATPPDEWQRHPIILPNDLAMPREVSREGNAQTDGNAIDFPAHLLGNAKEGEQKEHRPTRIGQHHH